MKFVPLRFSGNGSAFCTIMKKEPGRTPHSINAHDKERCAECGSGPLTTETSDHMSISPGASWVTLCRPCTSRYMLEYEPCCLMEQVVGAD